MDFYEARRCCRRGCIIISVISCRCGVSSCENVRADSLDCGVQASFSNQKNGLELPSSCLYQGFRCFHSLAAIKMNVHFLVLSFSSLEEAEFSAVQTCVTADFLCPMHPRTSSTATAVRLTSKLLSVIVGLAPESDTTVAGGNSTSASLSGFHSASSCISPNKIMAAHQNPRYAVELLTFLADRHLPLVGIHKWAPRRPGRRFLRLDCW